MRNNIMVRHASAETSTMDQRRLNEQMAPQEYIGPGIHPHPVPFGNETKGTEEGRA